MELTDTQKQAIKRMANEGCGLTDIQKRIKEEFDLSFTFIDLRFIILDLGLKLKDKEITQTGSIDLSNAQTTKHQKAGPIKGEDLSPTQATGSVSVDIDRIVKPGAVVSGTVSFSDGVTSSWMLDQHGRLALESSKPGYKPSQEDIQSFQHELSRLLQSRGF